MSAGEDVGAAIRRRLDTKYAAREVGLANTRQAIRRCANAIRACHRADHEQADALLGEARELLDVAESALAAHPDVYYAGFLQDGQKEYAEARITRAIVAGQPPPGPGETGVPDVPWLGGLAEAIGALRRHTLDRLRAGDVASAGQVFATMDELHGLLTELDFPDAMTSGLRRLTDVARAIVERTRGDLTLSVVQRDLAAALRRDGAAAPATGGPK
jgi:translin